MKNFFRKVAFGIGLNEEVPSDPLNWALNQVDKIPDFSWKGKILTEKELRGHYRDWVYGDREKLRKKYKNNKTLYKLYTKSYGGQIHFDIFGIDKKRKILGLSGFAGQQILIDLDNKRIIVVSSLYRNYNWKKIVHSVIKG